MLLFVFVPFIWCKRSEKKKENRNTIISRKKKKKKEHARNRYWTEYTYVKGRGEGKKRRYPGTECPLARKTFRFVVKISKNQRLLSVRYWERVHVGSCEQRVATITLSKFIVFSGIAADIDVQEIVDGIRNYQQGVQLYNLQHDGISNKFWDGVACENVTIKIELSN